MTDHKSAILFPGQGSQEQAMGRSLAETEAQAMELWKMAEKICGHPLREIFWGGTLEDMSETQYLQPALTVVNLNLWFFFRKTLRPGAVAGHSLGEYCALCASNVLEPQEILKLVSLRGRLMAESGRDSQGAMAAVLKLEKTVVEELADRAAGQAGQVLIVANYNTPRQFVVSGHVEALNTLEPMVAQAGGRLVKLPVSGAFHSPLMNEAARDLAKMMDKVWWKTPDCEIYFNSTARPERDPDKIKELMQRQMTAPVYFMQLIAGIREQGLNMYIEIGPKGVLSRMIPQILGSSDEITIVNVNGPDDENRLHTAVSRKSQMEAK